ncbi:hypothetical protein [Clostridium tertium]|uniref:hypothetical protein n=1 Tax=Clostridium tertium TaxID=1559 RepID=UPI0023B2587F|nr:hypothetical protein [Clostridium tertium]
MTKPRIHITLPEDIYDFSVYESAKFNDSLSAFVTFCIHLYIKSNRQVTCNNTNTNSHYSNKETPVSINNLVEDTSSTKLKNIQNDIYNNNKVVNATSVTEDKPQQIDLDILSSINNIMKID